VLNQQLPVCCIEFRSQVEEVGDQQRGLHLFVLLPTQHWIGGDVNLKIVFCLHFLYLCGVWSFTVKESVESKWQCSGGYVTY
jgi:hypothetical protein